MKLKHIAAAALAVASATPAFADLINTGSGNSELFLVVYGTAAVGGSDASYTLDLGILEKSFVLSPSLALPVQVGGVNWDAFASSVDLSTAKWAVMGGDNTGVSAGARNLVITVEAGKEAFPSQLPSDKLTASNSQIDAFVGEVNQTGGHIAAGNGDSFNKIGELGYFMKYNGDVLNQQLNFVNSNLIGVTSEITNLIRTTGQSPVNETVLGSIRFASIGSSYQLSTVAAAVPEPSGVALALTAFGVLGFVARRRRAD